MASTTLFIAVSMLTAATFVFAAFLLGMYATARATYSVLIEDGFFTILCNERPILGPQGIRNVRITIQGRTAEAHHPGYITDTTPI